MTVWAAIRDPLQGKTSLAKVVWVYGLLGSVLVSAIGLAFDPGNAFAMRIYSAFSVLFSVYVAVATYRCAKNSRSRSLARFVRVCAVISLLAIPVLAYMDFTGAFDRALATMSGEE